MPTNRKLRTRSWSPELDDYKWQSLLEGPESILLAGMGYHRYMDATTDAEREAALEEMRQDWEHHREQLLQWWIGAADDTVRRKPWVFPMRGGPGTRPWAWWEFDAPEAACDGERQADYLTRLGLLLPGEAEQLP